MKLTVQATRGALWTFVELSGHQLISFIFYVFLARLLGPGDFGIMALAVTILFLFDMILRNWITEPVVQRRDLEPAHLDTIFWVDIALAAVLCGLAIGFARPVANLFGQADLEAVLVWLAPTLLLKSLVIVKIALLQRDMVFRMLAIRSLVAAIGSGAVGLWMAFAGYGVMSLVGREIANVTIVFVILWAATPWRPGLRMSWRHFRDIFGFGKHMLAMGFIGYLSVHLITPLIGYFMSSVSAGLFNIANRITTTFASINEFAINRVTVAAFSQVQNDPKRLTRAFYKSVEFTSLVWFPVFFGLSSVAPEMTLTLLGEKWRDAIPLIQLLVLSGPARSLNGCGRSVLVARKKARWLLIENLVLVFIVVPVLFVSAQHSLVAVVMVFTAQNYLAVPVRAYLIRKVINLSLVTFSLRVLMPLLACAAMTFSVHFARGLTDGMNDLAALAFLVAVGAITYGIAIVIVAPSSVRTLFGHLRAALSLGPAKNVSNTGP